MFWLQHICLSGFCCDDQKGKKVSQHQERPDYQGDIGLYQSEVHWNEETNTWVSHTEGEENTDVWSCFTPTGSVNVEVKEHENSSAAALP